MLNNFPPLSFLFFDEHPKEKKTRLKDENETVKDKKNKNNIKKKFLLGKRNSIFSFNRCRHRISTVNKISGDRKPV